MTWPYFMGIAYAIMELKNQTGWSASNIKKTMQTMQEFADKDWIMFWATFNRSNLSKVKDVYTIADRKWIKPMFLPN